MVVRGVMADVRFITPMMPPTWQNSINGSCRASQGCGLGPPGAWWIIDRTIPAASWIIDRTITAASWIIHRTITAASWIIDRTIRAAS